MMRDFVKQFKESEKWRLKCLEINPKDCGTNASYGYSLYLMGQYDKAIKQFENIFLIA